jgi:hypothetical protein
MSMLMTDLSTMNGSLGGGIRGSASLGGHSAAAGIAAISNAIRSAPPKPCPARLDNRVAEPGDPERFRSSDMSLTYRSPNKE